MTTPHEKPSIYVPGPYDAPRTGQIPPRSVPAPPRPPSGSRRAWVIAGIAAAAAVLTLIAVGGLLAWYLTRPAASSTPATFSVAGSIQLGRGEFVFNSAKDRTCWGFQGYDDIRNGTEVTVADASGKVLVVGALRAGLATLDANGDGVQCDLPFRVDGVPPGVGPYGVEVSHRGVTHYAETDLRAGVFLGFN